MTSKKKQKSKRSSGTEKHTPGPWEVHGSTDIVKKGIQVIADVSAQQYLGGTWVREYKANAHLIAAAPELLTVCREAADRFGILYDANEATENDFRVLTHLRNVIAKAEGRQSALKVTPRS